jgi:hypothetical protein
MKKINPQKPAFNLYNYCFTDKQMAVAIKNISLPSYIIPGSATSKKIFTKQLKAYRQL